MNEPRKVVPSDDGPTTEAGRRLLMDDWAYMTRREAVRAIRAIEAEAIASAGGERVAAAGPHCLGCTGTIDIGVLDQHQPCPGIEAEAAAGPKPASSTTPQARDEGLRHPRDVMRDGPSEPTPLPPVPFSVGHDCSGPPDWNCSQCDEAEGRDERLREALRAAVDAWDRYVEAHAGRGHEGEHEPDTKLSGQCGPCVSAMYGTEVEMAEYVIPAARAALADSDDVRRGSAP